jgi:hypothetical protein
VLVAGNEVGATWQGALEKLGDQAGLKDALDAIEGATGLFGGMDGILGWIGDAGFVVDPTGTEVEAGFVIVPTDPDQASNLFGTLKTFISLGGGTVGLAVSDEAYGDTTITTLSVDLAKLGGVAGGLSGGATDGLGIPEGTFELSFAVDGDVVVIGNGPAFVKHVLDTDAGTSLGADPAFSDAVGRIGRDATGVTFVDIEAIRTTIEASLTGDDLAEYTTDVQPFLEPFVAMAATSTVGSDLDTLTTIITVK